jgi:hypothetical protein
MDESVALHPLASVARRRALVWLRASTMFTTFDRATRPRVGATASEAKKVHISIAFGNAEQL